MSDQKVTGNFPTVNRYRGTCACGEHAWAVLTKGFVTFVSPEDAHLLQARKWCAAPFHAGRVVYARTSGLHKGSPNRWLHREILGDVPGLEVDHQDHNGTNNRRSKLRYASHRQNLGNSRQALGASGFRGVSFDKETERWSAKIARQHLGRFATPEEAARAYDAAAVERFRQFATLNFATGPP